MRKCARAHVNACLPACAAGRDWGRHTREAFNRLDKDGNGYIDCQELSQELEDSEEVAKAMKV